MSTYRALQWLLGGVTKHFSGETKSVKCFTWREIYVLQRYVVSQISYGGSIDNMEQTSNCLSEVVFNVAVWYLSSRKMMSRYLLPD